MLIFLLRTHKTDLQLKQHFVFRAVSVSPIAQGVHPLIRIIPQHLRCCSCALRFGECLTYLGALRQEETRSTTHATDSRASCLCRSTPFRA